jgi:hypothetical protein
MGDTLSLADLIKGGQRDLITNMVNEKRATIERPTPDEGIASFLTKQGDALNNGSLGGAIVGGIAKGIGQGKQSKADRERAEKLAQLEEYQNQRLQWAMETEKKLQTQALAEQEAMQNGTVLADSLQALEMGDETGFRNFIAANQNVASLLGDDGPGGIAPEGGRIVVRNGAKFVQAYGKGPNGEPWAGQEVPLDGILQRYAPQVLEQRSKAALAAAQSQAELEATNALRDQRLVGTCLIPALAVVVHLDRELHLRQAGQHLAHHAGERAVIDQGLAVRVL